ncbi:MAG: alpha/beta hydrolase [Opitutae bacterium]
MVRTAQFLFVFLCFYFATVSAEQKSEINVSYGPHARNVLDVYWDTEYENAPIVFTIHGGGFRFGDKSYCNADMRKLYADHGCVVVSPNYRLAKERTQETVIRCAMDAAMAVAHIQANAGKYGGDPKRILSTGSSAGGFISAWIAYQKDWQWPEVAKHKPKKLNIIGWFGDSPFLPAQFVNQISGSGPPAFFIYGGKKEHPGTPTSQGYDIREAFNQNKIWNKMVHVDYWGHVPARRFLFSPKTRDTNVFNAYDEFLKMILNKKEEAKSGEIITVSRT